MLQILKDIMDQEKALIERTCCTLDVIMSCMITSFGEGFINRVDENTYELHFSSYDAVIKRQRDGDKYDIHVNGCRQKEHISGDQEFTLDGRFHRYCISDEDACIRKCFNTIIEQINIIADSTSLTKSTTNSKANLGWNEGSRSK